MSANTSAGRVFYGVQSDNYGISQPAVSQSVDLRSLTRSGRAKAVAAGNGTASPLAGLSEMTDTVIANARGPRKSKQQELEQEQHPAEQARQEHQQSTLDALTDQANRTAAEPAVRTGHQTPDGRVAMSTRDTRDFKTTADGPLGSYGQPAGGFTGTGWPGTFGGDFGGI